MTDQNSKKLSGIVPLPPREVSAAPYVVQPGDTVESITGRFTHPSKWPGLVGANAAHKELVDAEGHRHAVFKELRVGETLNIPAAWVGVGAPIVSRAQRMRPRLGQASGGWDSTLPNHNGTWIKYWVERLTATVAHNASAYAQKWGPCARSIPPSYVEAYLRRFATPAQFEQQLLHGLIEAGVASASVPPGLWFVNDAGPEVASNAADDMVRRFCLYDYNASGNVGGCQTYGLDQFRGVIGYTVSQQRPPEMRRTTRPMSAVQTLNPWDAQHPQWSGSYLAYWSQRIAATVANTANWHVAPYHHCGSALHNNPSMVHKAINDYLRSFPSPQAFEEQFPPNIAGYPAFVPDDVWFASPLADRHTTVNATNAFVNGRCWSIPAGAVGEPGQVGAIGRFQVAARPQVQRAPRIPINIVSKPGACLPSGEPIWQVKPYYYVVQPEDLASFYKIPEKFGMPLKVDNHWTWRDLLNANLDWPGGFALDQKHIQCLFDGLVPGSKLKVPDSWGDPIQGVQTVAMAGWDDKHPNWNGSNLAYWSQRFEAAIKASVSKWSAFQTCADALDCAVAWKGGMPSPQPQTSRSRLLFWLRAHGAPDQLKWVLSQLPSSGPNVITADIPPDLWFADAQDRSLVARGAAQFASSLFCYEEPRFTHFNPTQTVCEKLAGTVAGNVGAPGQVDGCQTYGMDQFGGVAGFERMVGVRTRPQLQAAPQHRPVLHVQSPWDQQLAPGSQYTQLSYWSDRIRRFAKYVIENELGAALPGASLFLGVMNVSDDDLNKKILAFLRHYASPAEFEHEMAREGTSGGPTTDGGSVAPARAQTRTLSSVPMIDGAYAVPEVWYHGEDDARHAAIGAFIMLPEWWIMPGGGAQQAASGSVGALPIETLKPSDMGIHQGVTIDIAAPAIAFFTANWPKILNMIKTLANSDAWQVPVGPGGTQYTTEDIARVVTGFLPYLAKMPAGSIPATITTVPPLPTNPAQWGDMLPALAKSAAELLGVTQVATGNVLQSVPWDEVPWQSFPWPTVKSFPNCWSFVQGSLQQQGVTQKPAQPQIYPAPLPPNYTPNLLGDWTTGPWENVPWDQINWSLVDPSIWEADKVQECMKDGDASKRLQEMMKYQQCFIGKGADVFAKYLCKKSDGTYEDLAGCDRTTGTTCPDGQVLVNGVCVPTTNLPQCETGYQGFPAPGLPMGIACCEDGSVYDLTSGQCLKPGATTGTQPAQPVGTSAKKDEGLSTFAKLGIGVAAVGTLGLVYALWSNAE